jgi:8-oxo-dGTP pyrophosphatase MutT (NUDIX family)
MLVRDGHDGLEVFMLRRSLDSVFVGGAYVFPGGGVDEADRHDDLEPVCAGRADADASALLGVDVGGLAYWVAAIRESFEEAGVLLAYDRDGALVRFDDPELDARFRHHRHRVDRGEVRLVDVCAAEGLTLACDAIHYFSHWITPVGPPRRYDTRFFVARAPDAQTPLHDDRETIAHLWVRPADALARHRAGELDMILPTIRNLEAIARFDRADHLLAAAAATTTVPAVLPRIVAEDGGVRILLPGDDGYDDPDRPVVRPDDTGLPGRPGGPPLPDGGSP